ncbi:hypothetical protein BC831DRAFT_464756 [Entophlyctis helioformis]|nr:hypothetical protein BC831DRAFT_464756 [Entophlyctis helioformis]
MPNNKIKKISNIKNIEKAHPYSRKATQMNRAVLREERTAQKKVERDGPKRMAVERMLWFKYAMPDDKPALSDADLHDIVTDYINRNDDEIDKLHKQHQARKERPKPTKLDILEALRAKDSLEYSHGTIEVPALTDARTVELLKAWDGDHNSMSSIKKIRVRNPIAVAAAQAAKATAAGAAAARAEARAEAKAEANAMQE